MPRYEADRVRVDNGPPYWVHHFAIRNESELDTEFRGWLRESYLLGSGELR